MEAEEAGSTPGIEFHENIDVTVRAEVVSDN